MRKILSLFVALVLVAGLSVGSATAGVNGDIQFVDERPDDLDRATKVSGIENPKDYTGGIVKAITGKEFVFDQTVGNINGSMVNAIGASNVGMDLEAGELNNKLRGYFRVRTGNVVNSALNGIGAANIVLPNSQANIMDANLGGDFRMATKRIRGSNVNGIGGINFYISDAEGDLFNQVKAKQQGSYRFVTRFGNNGRYNVNNSTVNAIGAANVALQESGEPTVMAAQGGQFEMGGFSSFGNSFTVRTGNVRNGSALNAIGALNFLTTDASELKAGQGGDFRVSTGNVRNSEVNAMGAANILLGEVVEDDTVLAFQGESASFNVSTGNVSNSTVNGIGAFNFYMGPMNPSSVAEANGSNNFSIGNVTNGSTVNTAAAMNLSIGAPGSDVLLDTANEIASGASTP